MADWVVWLLARDLLQGEWQPDEDADTWLPPWFSARAAFKAFLFYIYEGFLFFGDPFAGAGQLAWAGGEAGGRVGEGSVMSQHAYLGRVKDMLESIEAQSRPVWTRMGTLEEAAVVVASRSPYELIMLSTGDTHSWQCILHPRALAKVLPSGYTPFDCFVDAV